MRKLPAATLRALASLVLQGLASRAIASQLGLSKTTINNLAARIQSGTQEQRQQLAHMPDSVLLEFFYPPIVKAKEEPDWIDIHKKLYRRGVTLTLLYKQYKAQAVRETYNYASFCRRYGEWRKTNGVDAPGGNIERIPGERMEIDFAGDSLKWIDPDCNVRYARVFVAVFPYSNLTYAEAFDNEKQPSWIAGVVHALNFIGGTPQVLVMDNARALVKASNWYEGEVQQTVRSLCNYYGVEAWPCQPRKPKQKNRVEAGVGLAERRIIAAMSLDQTPIAKDLADLNRQVWEKLKELNDEPFSASKILDSRRQMFENEERQHLGELPPQNFCPLDIRILTVDRGHCIRLANDGHRYSTPAEYIGKRVSVTVTDDKVLIYDLETWEAIGEHPRYTNARGNKTHILPKHLTAAEKKYRRQPHEWVAELVKAGLSVELADALVSHLRNGRSNFPCGRACNALLQLFKHYPIEIVRQALSHRLECGRVTYREARDCCEQIAFAKENNMELDFNGNRQEEEDYQSPLHANIRGNYQ